MRELKAFDPIESGIHYVMDSLSNREAVPIREEVISSAVAEFEQALRKQLLPENREFGLRASNIGRPLCQLINEKNDSPRIRMDYNHIMRMMLGDVSEILLTVILRIAGINITDSKTKRRHAIQGVSIPGEIDVEIDDKIFDIKSASPIAYDTKWEKGWEGLLASDHFGYPEQLYIYADGELSKMGGWIVLNKSSGEVKVVRAEAGPKDMELLKGRIQHTIKYLDDNKPLVRGFSDEEETYYRKPTGNRVLQMVCQMCPYVKTCWPEAVHRPKIPSTAANPPLTWYTHIEKDRIDG